MPLFEAVVVTPQGQVINTQVYAQSTTDARNKLENSYLSPQSTTVPQVPCVYPASRY